MGDNRHTDDGVSARPITVHVKYFGDSKEDKEKALEKAISQFKKIVQKEGLMQELKDRESFVSPGRKRYLARQKFYWRLAQKKEKDAKTFRRKDYVEKKDFTNKGGDRPHYNRPYQPRPQGQGRPQGQQQRPNQPIKRFNHDRDKR